MEKTNGSITSEYMGGTKEEFFFTYDESEKQENRFNKFIVEQERKGWSYFVIEQQQLALGFTEPEAIIYNFVDGYTKSGKYFWFSTSDICEKLYWGKDKVINTIKSLEKKGYITREKGKDRFGNQRRFLSTTTKYSLELLKLRGLSENQIGVIGKSDRGLSENPTHSIIDSTINNTISNVSGFESLPKPESVKPTLEAGDLTFEEIYNLFYHKSGRKSSKDKCKKVFESLHLDKEGYEMLVKDLKLFRIEYKYGIKDQQYRPKFETYVGGFNAEGVNEEYRLKMIIKYHMENSEDIEKGKKRYKDLCDTFGKELVDKLVKQYGKNKNKITLKAD